MHPVARSLAPLAGLGLTIVVACGPAPPATRAAGGPPAATAAASGTPAPPAGSAVGSPPPAPPATAPTAAATALAVHFHPQRDPDWCDPADLEMWLELDGVAQPADEVAAQRALWNFEVAHNDGFTLAQWHASPYAVAAAFDHAANRTDVGDAPFTDVQAAGAVISRSVATQREPVIVLVDGGTHYVLVSGVTLGAGGTGAPPASVIVYDPWTYGPTRDGYPTMGETVELSWAAFVGRFTPDDPHDLGIWSGRWVLIAAGLPLRG